MVSHSFAVEGGVVLRGGRMMIILDGFGFLDLVFSSVSDKDGLASPFDDDVLAFGNSTQVDFHLGLSQHIGRCGHVDEEICVW